MDEGKHLQVPLERLLPAMGVHSYPQAVVTGSRDQRRVRVDDDLWAAYEKIVGDGGRSADLRAYIEWRVDNPTTPLPGKRRGPVKKVRKSSIDDADKPDD